MSLQLKGIVSKVLPIESGEGKEGKEWKRQTFVLAYKDGEYEKSVAVSVFGDKVDKVPGTGQECTVSFNVESKEYNGKYYTNVNAWKIEVSGGSARPQDNPTSSPTFDGANGEINSELPF